MAFPGAAPLSGMVVRFRPGAPPADTSQVGAGQVGATVLTGNRHHSAATQRQHSGRRALQT